ncbi:MAG: aspartate aminotransferase family protein [Chitinophagales bacterium]
MNQRELFFRHLAQTSPLPLGLEISRAEGMVLYAQDGREFLDLIGGISVSNMGHRHPAVVEAIKRQVDQYLHLMVYGELIQSPQVEYAGFLTKHLPPSLDSVYFTNSGTEATEGAMKLAKRASGRTQFIAFNHSYHGSTQGALSIIGDEYWRNAFRPLLPDILHLEYNNLGSLNQVTDKTAAVFVESIQAERGVYTASLAWIRELRRKCDKHDVLLVMDEIQSGFGRTGSLWAFEQLGIVPDILLLGKALGGGMPLGAFIASRNLMLTLTNSPVLGHITTFGGHPVSCAAGLASTRALLDGPWITEVFRKEKLFRKLLVHSEIKAIRSMGLLIAVEFSTPEINKKIIDHCIDSGLLTDWFLFAPECMRIAPPLIISDKEIIRACHLILQAIDKI